MADRRPRHLCACGCGRLLDPANADRGTHPACDPTGRVDQAAAIALLARELGGVVIGEAAS